MMDQNRCLLDVIDNPQLLQSFLESEPSADNTNTNTTTHTNSTNAAAHITAAAAAANNNNNTLSATDTTQPTITRTSHAPQISTTIALISTEATTPSTTTLKTTETPTHTTVNHTNTTIDSNSPLSAPTTTASNVTNNINHLSTSSNNNDLQTSATIFEHPATPLHNVASTTDTPTTDTFTTTTTHTNSTTSSSSLHIEPQRHQQTLPSPSQTPLATQLTTTTTAPTLTTTQEHLHQQVPSSPIISGTTNHESPFMVDYGLEHNDTQTNNNFLPSIDATHLSQLQNTSCQDSKHTPPVDTITTNNLTHSTIDQNSTLDSNISSTNFNPTKIKSSSSDDVVQSSDFNTPQSYLKLSNESLGDNIFSGLQPQPHQQLPNQVDQQHEHQQQPGNLPQNPTQTQQPQQQQAPDNQLTSNPTCQYQMTGVTKPPDNYTPTTSSSTTENGSSEQVKLERISNDPLVAVTTSTPIVSTAFKTSPTISVTTTTATTTTTTVTNSKTTPTNSGETKPSTKRAAPRSRAKNNKNSTTNTSSNQSSQSSTPKPNSQQYATTPQVQQQIIYNQGNVGIRQPMIAPTSMGQQMGTGGLPQQQRVIQIQTANGPMYFAIAPGPMVGNNQMVNQQSGMQSQQQYPSQQLCFQPNSSVMINRQPLTQQPLPTQMLHQHQQPLQKPHALQSPQNQQTPPLQQNQMQQQQQPNVVMSSASGNIAVNGQQMIQSSPHPTRLASPMMAGQTMAIQGQQGSQQMVIPSSQPMMMPRMPNQLILNRPLNNPGQLLPGQQQFIQILTPNGPVLLALPSQHQSQPLNQPMIDYNNQVQPSQNTLGLGQPIRPPGLQTSQSSSPITTSAPSKPADMVDGSNNIMSTSNSDNKNSNQNKTSSDSKSGLDLADILMDCGIIPEDKNAAASSTTNINVKSSQSPSLPPINSPVPAISQLSSPMPTLDSSQLSSNTPGQLSAPHYPGQPPMQQQPIRITFGPDGQMVMQPAVYGAIRPMMPGPVGQAQYSAVAPNGGMIHTNTPIMATYTSSPSGSIKPNTTTTTPSSSTDGDGAKKGTKTKGSGVKRSRSKKADIDKFPQLKTPKIAQQQKQQQQQLQAVTVVPMTVLSGSDVKPSVAQIGGQQVSLTKIVTPVLQSTSLQSSASSNILQTNVPTTHGLTTSASQGITNSVQLVQNSTNQLESGSIRGVIGVQQQQQQSQNQQQQATTTVVDHKTSFSTSGSQMGSSGNVITNLLPGTNKPGTVESNPHISSSLMPTLSISVDTLAQNGIKLATGHTTVKGTNASGLTTTLVIHSSQLQQLQLQSVQNQKNLAQRRMETCSQAILNQLNADQNMVLNPQTKQSFKSIEDACKQLLRYHVFDTQPASENHVRKVDEIFEAAVESLLKRKKSIYDKFRYLVLKQSMATVPKSEEVMLEQIFVNDELKHVKKEREVFKACDDEKDDQIKDDCAPEYFAFGNNSPKQNNRDDSDTAPQSRDVDDWLMADTWGESRYSSVPDSEAATAIESILNDELS